MGTGRGGDKSAMRPSTELWKIQNWWELENIANSNTKICFWGHLYSNIETQNRKNIPKQLKHTYANFMSPQEKVPILHINHSNPFP